MKASRCSHTVLAFGLNTRHWITSRLRSSLTRPLTTFGLCKPMNTIRSLPMMIPANRPHHQWRLCRICRSDLALRTPDKINRKARIDLHPTSLLRHAQPNSALTFLLECTITISPVNGLTGTLNLISALFFRGGVKGFLVKRLNLLSINISSLNTDI